MSTKEGKITRRELDLTNAGRAVWLVKVPKYIAKKWEKAQNNAEVGKLTISKVKGEKSKLSMALSDATMKIDPHEKIPKHHVLQASNVTNQTLGIFTNEASDGSAGVLSKTGKLLLDGRIVQKMECRPVIDSCYMKLKSESIKKASVPVKQVKRLDKIVQNFKPVSNHKHNIEQKERKKAEGKKCRDEKNVVLDQLFNAFEKHQYYNIKDLVKITNQPVTYLKEVMKEVCDYNMKHPHKNMWELKKEYRHYNTGDQN